MPIVNTLSDAEMQVIMKLVKRIENNFAHKPMYLAVNTCIIFLQRMMAGYMAANEIEEVVQLREVLNFACDFYIAHSEIGDTMH